MQYNMISHTILQYNRSVSIASQPSRLWALGPHAVSRGTAKQPARATIIITTTTTTTTIVIIIIISTIITVIVIVIVIVINDNDDNNNDNDHNSISDIKQ